jgi:hypothetical protein
MDADHADEVPITATEMSVELVFCSTAANIVELDCRAMSGPGAGWPFSMRLGLPGHAAWSAAAERMLTRWAGQSAVLSVEIKGGRHTAQVRLSDGVAAVLLDAAAAGTVFH